MLPDEGVREHLVAVRGNGRWTAFMYLKFSLDRPDVFPTEDMAILVAIRRLYVLESRPTLRVAGQLMKDGGWSPFRTAASFFLWDSLK
jgi:DNA-3-methyladenine glycosylase II